jgi:N-acetylglucosamine kinase-like BadF-type ATPase
MIIGIDGGGTRSELVLLDPDYQEQARFSGPSLQALRLSEDNFRTNLKTLLNQLETSQLEAVSHIGAGLAGAHRTSLQAKVKRTLTDLVPDSVQHIEVRSDIEATHRGAFDDQDGLMIVLGTGSVALARVSDEWNLVGGYGYKIGDEAGGYDLGSLALNLATRHLDGIYTYPELMEMLRAQHSPLKDREDLIAWVYEKDLDPATLAPALLDLGEQNRNYEALLQHRVDRFLDHLQPVIDSLNATPLSVCLGGGLMQHNFYMGLVYDRMQHRFKNIQLMAPRFDPAVGATRVFGHQTS